MSFIDENTGKKRYWEWKATKDAYFADHMDLYPAFALYRGTQGHAREVGDQRKLRYYFGWPDFYNDGRVERFNKYGPDKGWSKGKLPN